MPIAVAKTELTVSQSPLLTDPFMAFVAIPSLAGFLEGTHQSLPQMRMGSPEICAHQHRRKEIPPARI